MARTPNTYTIEVLVEGQWEAVDNDTFTNIPDAEAWLGNNAANETEYRIINVVRSFRIEYQTQTALVAV